MQHREMTKEEEEAIHRAAAERRARLCIEKQQGERMFGHEIDPYTNTPTFGLAFGDGPCANNSSTSDCTGFADEEEQKTPETDHLDEKLRVEREREAVAKRVAEEERIREARKQAALEKEQQLRDLEALRKREMEMRQREDEAESTRDKAPERARDAVSTPCDHNKSTPAKDIKAEKQNAKGRPECKIASVKKQMAAPKIFVGARIQPLSPLPVFSAGVPSSFLTLNSFEFASPGVDMPLTSGAPTPANGGDEVGYTSPWINLVITNPQ